MSFPTFVLHMNTTPSSSKFEEMKIDSNNNNNFDKMEIVENTSLIPEKITSPDDILYPGRQCLSLATVAKCNSGFCIVKFNKNFHLFIVQLL